MPNFPDNELIADLTSRMLLEVGAVHFRADEPFRFTSGWASPVYIDCRKLISYPRVRGTLEVESLSLVHRSSAFDLTLMLAEAEGGLSGSLEYCTDLFEASTAARMAKHFETLLAATLNSAAPDMAKDYLLTSIAAVLLGMTMFEPGRCNVPGTLVGAATIGMLGNGLVLMGAPYYVQDIMLGFIIVASVAVSASALKKAAFGI